MEPSACLPSLQAPALSHNLKAFGCRYLDLVFTGEDETRKWLLKAPGLRFPELATEGSTHTWGGPGQQALLLRSKGSTFTDALRCSQSTVTAKK